MSFTKEEIKLLSLLASGILDGMVGDERVYPGYRNVYCGKYIKDGEPISYRQGESTRFFNGKENERIPGKRVEEHFDTDVKSSCSFRSTVGCSTIPRFKPIALSSNPHPENPKDKEVPVHKSVPLKYFQLLQ